MTVSLARLRRSVGLVTPLLAFAFLTTCALALNVVINRTQTGVEIRQFAVTSSGYYKHTGRAPSDGSIYTDVEYGPGIIHDSFALSDGACLNHNVYLWVRDDWYLELNVTEIFSGTASACVFSPELGSCCPDPNQN